MDEKRRAAGQKLLDAAHEFWRACAAEGQYGAVQWLTGSRGELLVFTRGEYRDALLNNIWDLKDRGQVHEFSSEELPDPDDHP